MATWKEGKVNRETVMEQLEREAEDTDYIKKFVERRENGQLYL